MSSAVLCEHRGDAAWITLNRPERRNALSDEMVPALIDALDAAQADSAVRFIVLTGSGPAFCAGADLKAGGMRNDNGEPPFIGILRRLQESPKPVIGRINGHAFGGGLGLLAACDLVIASSAAQFSFSEVRIGVVPAMISVVVLPKIGTHHGMWLFLTGERFDAERACEVGLLHRVAAPEELDAEVEKLLGMLRLGGPNALRAAKELVRRVPKLSTEEAYHYTGELIGGLFASAEAAEGMRAFAEKRTPNWGVG